MMVDVGLVVGVIEPITPNGARSTRVSPRSPVQVIGRRYGTRRPDPRQVARRFADHLPPIATGTVLWSTGAPDV